MRLKLFIAQSFAVPFHFIYRITNRPYDGDELPSTF